MRWPWQRRTAAGSAGRHALPRQAASWAEPAFPPAPLAAPAAPAAGVPSQPQAPVAVPVQAAPASAVLLGFADGTHVALDERDPSALALRAVAELLVQDRAV